MEKQINEYLPVVLIGTVLMFLCNGSKLIIHAIFGH